MKMFKNPGSGREPESRGSWSLEVEEREGRAETRQRGPRWSDLILKGLVSEDEATPWQQQKRPQTGRQEC